MSSLLGIPASAGATYGKFFLLTSDVPMPTPAKSTLTAAEEKKALDEAVVIVSSDLADRASRATGELQEILIAVAEIAGDPALIEEAHTHIDNGDTAAYAILKASELFKDLLEQSGGYLAERVSDVGNICDRILCQLAGTSYPEIPQFKEPTVLIARDLSPADTTDLVPSQILAIITEAGGPTSHTAIIARSLGIPAVVACQGLIAKALAYLGQPVGVIATSGEVFFDPGPDEISAIENQIEKIRIRKLAQQQRSSAGYKTKDGRGIPIYANVGRFADGEKAVSVGADGVGLLRTELLYLDQKVPPTLEEQADRYTQIFELFPEQKVVIRTLDAGADKPLAFINFGHEPNPALGVRGYRTITLHEELLRTQLAAISLAQSRTKAEVWVMAPMITVPQEAQDFLDLCREYNLAKSGVMIEVPAAVFHAEEITRISDFVSIGTNDLGQYLHAADRESAALAHFNNPWQPALIRAIHQIAQAGLRNNCPVGVCGEAASDAALATVLLGLGVTSLSCNVATLSDVAMTIGATNYEEMKSAAAAALSQHSATDAQSMARKCLPALTELGL